MSPPRVGIWFIGARGGVAATATVGLLALQKNLTGNVGLVSELPQFRGLDFAGWDSFVVGGHEIRDETLLDSVERLRTDSRVLNSNLVEACRDELAAIDSRVRPGSLANCGNTIGGLAGSAAGKFAKESARDGIKRLQHDLREFRQQTAVERVVVVNVASTEPANDALKVPDRWDELAKRIDDCWCSTLPASSLYAIAALDLGMPYINFTPSLGASPTAIQELAELKIYMPCGPGRKNRRDAAQKRASADVCRPPSRSLELGWPQHFWQPRRPRA